MDNGSNYTKKETGDISKYNMVTLRDSLQKIINKKDNYLEEMRKLVRHKRLLDTYDYGQWPEDSMTLYLRATKEK